MRMTGASTASAPWSCNARTRSPACSRARVTTMRRPFNDPTGVMLPRRCNLTVAQPIIKQCSVHFVPLSGVSARAVPLRRNATPRAARFARAYAAGGGATALWHNAQALYDGGDHGAADEALNLWATQVPDGHSRLPEARAELRAKAAARAQVQ